MDGGYHELLEVFPLERPTCNLGIFYCPGIRAAMVLIGPYLWVGLFYMAAFHLVYGSGRRVSRVGRRGASFSVGGVRGDQRWGGTKLGSCLDASYFRSGMASCDFILFASSQMKGQRGTDWWCGSFRCVAWDIFFQHWDMLLLLRVDVYIVYAPVLWGRMWDRHIATLHTYIYCRHWQQPTAPLLTLRGLDFRLFNIPFDEKSRQSLTSNFSLQIKKKRKTNLCNPRSIIGMQKQ